MSTQNVGVHLTTAAGANINTPILDVAAIFRGDEAFGAGIYRAKMSDGTTIEIIGGPGSSVLTTIESGTFTLAADGMSATINGVDAGAALTNPGTNPILTITTTKKLKLCKGLVNITDKSWLSASSF